MSEQSKDHDTGSPPEGRCCGGASTVPILPKPPWVRVSMPSGESYRRVKGLMRMKTLNTVCEQALCPNIAECWGQGTATFLILGDVCTRNCGFCAVKTGKPSSIRPDMEEASRLAQAVLAMNLSHVVITSVTRDDLPDGGASVFAEAVRRVHERVPGCTVEVLLPDLQGDRAALAAILDARPEILGHNVETVPRLYPAVRSRASYERSLLLLRSAGELNPDVLTKSGLMVGLGEEWNEILEVMENLRSVGCDILTIGQYLSPGRSHLPVVRYYTPEEFEVLKETGRKSGFRWVESGPLVRSSYHAECQARELAGSNRRSTLCHR